MATEYTFLVEDVITGEIGELPLNDVVYEDYLNRPGKMSATLPLADADENVDLLDVGRRAIYVVRNGTIDWGGLLMSAQVPLGGKAVSLDVIGWLGWLDMRDIWTDRQFSATDQFEIFQTLVDDAQDPLAEIQYAATGLPTGLLAGAGADMGIVVVWSALSGVERDRTEEYRWFNGKNLGEALRQLAALEDGFDYGMRFAIAAGGGSIDKSIELSYPMQGVDYSDRTGFEYVRGERSNILDRGISRDATSMAWRMRGWGTGQDISRLQSTVVDEDLRGVYPFFDGQYQGGSIVVQGTLDERTTSAALTRNHPVVLPSVVVDPLLDPVWDAYGLGDTYNFEIVDGYCSTSGAHRIIGYKMDAEKDLPILYLQAS